jgi:predicted dehydrogenase
MIRVGIIGCGKIADAHAEIIQTIPQCEIVGACDIEELMAKQFSERFSVKRYFSDVNELLAVESPDIVHITTPPQNHFPLAKLCLESGSHVYVEKPFTINAEEAEELVRLASEKGRKMTVGHDYQFTHAAREMRELIRTGYLGGLPVHMESLYCYDLGDPTYARAMLGEKEHWVRRLPGGLLQNIISHGICKIAEFLRGDCPTVTVRSFRSQFLKSLGESDIVDELRATIQDEENRTAYFTFSTQIRPQLHQLRLYGLKNGIIVDHDHQTIIKLRGTRYKSHMQRFVPPVIFAGQYLANWSRNVKRFLRNDFHMNSGMRFLIKSFYRSAVEDAPLPIPYREIILTSKLVDAVISQLQK